MAETQDPPKDPAPDPPQDPPVDPPPPEPKGEEDPPKDADWWKAMSRKWEREAKTKGSENRKLKTERDEHAQRLAEIEAANLSEAEKAIAQAREEARAEALNETGKALRASKLELAVARIASVRGIKASNADDAPVLKFADPDDVQMWLERQIEKGELDDIYADGKVDEGRLIEELVGLAQAKPGWLVTQASPPNGGVPAGDPDGGKGASAKTDDMNALIRGGGRR